MEVHHPHHPSHKKKWSEYLLEFFMLFFAVTLGFWAENLREHYVEREREFELAKSLYNEMKADSVDLDRVIAFRIKKEGYLDYMYTNFKGDVDNDSIQKTYQVGDMIAISANSSAVFEPRNAVIHQLESSGMMRYFKDEQIQADLHSIINAADQVKNRMQREFETYQNYVLPASIKYRNLDFEREISINDSSKSGMVEILERYLKSNRYLKYPKRNIPKEDLNAFHRCLELYRLGISSGRKGHLTIYKHLNEKLLSDLRAYYKL